LHITLAVGGPLEGPYTLQLLIGAPLEA